MEKKKYYVTTPIYYPSAKLHIGHTYCTTIADAIARFQRLAGADVLFLTGSDEHGQKIERAAEAKGVTPIQYVDEIVALFQNLWKKLNISNDDFIRTTEKRHEQVVQELFQRSYDKGDIYKSAYEGWYCTPCESFWPENKLDEQHLCPDCGRPLERLKEESYFFKMSNYADQWLQFIEENPDFIQPESRRNEMIAFVKSGLEDLCVSRTSFSWGIPVPFDPKHVVYVWFDALANYLTAAGYLDDKEKFAKFWPADTHLVGKEIVRFHAIIWPIMLMSLDLPLPKKIFGHGWLVVNGDKMSKSKGNVIDPIPLIETYGADPVRYYLLREISLGQDGNFSLESFITRINADLANDLGNLLHRTLSMVEKYHGGIVKGHSCPAPIDEELAKMAVETAAKVEQYMEDWKINDALKELWAFIGRTNKYIDETAPWILAKEEESAARLETVMYHLVEALRVIAILVSPIIPESAENMWKQLGLGTFAPTLEEAKTWGLYPVGTAVQKGEPLFPRFELPEEEEVEEEVKRNIPEIKELIGIEEFDKIDLRVGTVLACEKVPKTDKLLQLTVDLGTDVRTIVSGIALHYKPEEMVGKHVVVVANLKPVKLRGIESRGMILAASDENGKLTLPEAPMMLPGSRVK